MAVVVDLCKNSRHVLKLPCSKEWGPGLGSYYSSYLRPLSKGIQIRNEAWATNEVNDIKTIKLRFCDKILMCVNEDVNLINTDYNKSAKDTDVVPSKLSFERISITRPQQTVLRIMLHHLWWLSTDGVYCSMAVRYTCYNE